MMAEPMARTTILIADDHTVVAEGLAVSLSPYFAVVGQVTQLDHVLGTIKRASPDVVVLDISFGGRSSLTILKEAHEDDTIDSKFVILTAHESRALAAAAFEAGASAFLVKGASTHELRLAVEAALEGRRFSLTEDRDHARDVSPGSPWGDAVRVAGIMLRPRHVRILNLLVDGLDRADIARVLDMTIKGVDYHLRGAREAVGTPNMRLLALWAHEHVEALRQALAGYGEDEPLLP